MAHRIAYKPTGIVLSSLIGEIPIDVDGTFVDVRLTAPGSLVVLSERYYAYGGSVTLYDLGSLIENEMRKSGIAYGDFTLALYRGNAVEDSCTMHVLYCDRFTVCTDTDTFLAENFLSTLQHRRVAPGDTTSLFFFAVSGESIAANIAVRFRLNGNVITEPFHTTLGSGNTADGNAVRQINISQQQLVNLYKAAFTPTVSTLIEVVTATVSVGQRSVTLYVDRSLDMMRDAFMFRNCFNVWDAAILPRTTKAKTDVERSTAVVNTRSQFYNQRTTQTFEVETGPITSDEAEWLDQLFTSYSVMRVETNACSEDDPYLLVPVLITDSTCEVSDTDEKPNTVKFTWRFEDNRPIVRLSASSGIFTHEFTLPYS